MIEAKRIKARNIVVATGLWPRRRLRKLKAGLQLPDGEIALDDDVMLGGEWVEMGISGETFRARYAYPPLFVLHKQTGYVTSRRSNAGNPTVFELLETELADFVEPVGRLDMDTSGVLLFTADGTLLHRLTHPKREVVRTYAADLDAPIDEAGVTKLLAGEVTLDDGFAPQPRRIEIAQSDRRRVIVDLVSGKYHEVRRMFAAVGAPVAKLHRSSYGPVTLDGLRGGEFRRADDAELARVYAAVDATPTADFLEIELTDG